MAEARIDALKITYAQLNHALLSLGFAYKKTTQYLAYRETAHDVLIVLPVEHANALVREPHLIGIRNSVVGKGLLSQLDFYSLLKMFSDEADRSALLNAPEFGTISVKGKRGAKLGRSKSLSPRKRTENELVSQSVVPSQRD